MLCHVITIWARLLKLVGGVARPFLNGFQWKKLQKNQRIKGYMSDTSNPSKTHKIPQVTCDIPYLLVCFELHLQINYPCLIASHSKFCWKVQQVTNLLWPPWTTSFVTWQKITMSHKAHFLTQTLIQSFILQAIWMLSSGILMIIYLVSLILEMATSESAVQLSL